MAGQYGRRLDIMTQLPLHMTSSSHDADLNGNNSRRTLHPHGFITVAFIFSELDRWGFRSPLAGPEGRKKPGLDRVKIAKI